MSNKKKSAVCMIVGFSILTIIVLILTVLNIARGNFEVLPVNILAIICNAMTLAHWICELYDTSE